MRVVSIVGARPNLMKIAAVDRALRRHDGIEPVLVHTGQHYDERLSGLFLEQLGLPAPDHYLGVGSGPHGEQTGRIMIALEPLLLELEPALVIVVGDVNSTAAAALVAAKLGQRVAHVEAGLRSFDRTMPEELNRIVTDALSDLLFVTEPSGTENLRREGIPPERIHFVGNVMIDTLLEHRERAAELDMPARLGLEPGGYAVATLHRPANVDSPAALARLIAVLEGVAERLPIIFPVHPRTAARLRNGGQWQSLSGIPALRLVEPLGYLEFLGLMADARVVLTDSGGIQEETTVLGVPCLTLRENTERPVTIERGTNRLAGREPSSVLAALDDVLGDGHRATGVPELWDGRAAERIADIILRLRS